MPTYRYRCGSCGEEHEIWQSINDARLTVHEGDCGGPLARVLSPAGIVLKGSGFYKTDNRSKNGGGGRSDAPAKTDKGASSGDKGASSGDKGASSGDKATSSTSSNNSTSPPSKAAASA